MEKLCKRCGELKLLTAFSKATTKDGHSNMCKPCAVVKTREYSRTPAGRISSTYATQVNSSKVRQHNPPTYSRDELTDWAFKNGLDDLMTPWIASGYLKDLAPSVDRVDPNKGYTLDNIQLVTWAENNSKAYTDRKSCTHVTRQCCRVRQLTMDRMMVKEYASMAAAARETGVCRTAINSVCRGTYSFPHVGGFIWEYIT